MLVLSHRGRGGVSTAPDNTLEGFTAAAEIGVAGFETDVQCLADGSLVLFHDRVLADGTAVATLTPRELCESAGVAVPLLADALAAFPGHVWNLEIKDPRVVDGLGAVIPEGTRVLVSSFHHASARAGAAAAGGMGPGFLFAHRPLESDAVVQAYRGSGEAWLIWDAGVVDTRVLAACRRAGLHTGLYGVAPGDVDSIVQGGLVDLVIADHQSVLEALTKRC
ncbi:MAG: glycerophosphodiester phosphodiesterase [Ectothiorhodospiraceae bacterium]